jgi:hyaluronoglucosaminidase
MSESRLRAAQARDTGAHTPAASGEAGGFAVRGAIEGFYGRPFTWEEREAMLRFLGAAGMNTFVYAPKNDPLHRERWREPYGAEDLAGLSRAAAVAAESGLRFLYAIAPGLTYEAADAAEFGRLEAKLQQVLGAGANGIALLFDDIAHDSSAVDPILQADLVARCAARVAEIAPGADFWFIGNYYAGTAAELSAGGGIFASIYGRPPSDYFEAYADRVPPEIPILWTGPAVFSATLTRGDALAFADLVRRPVIVWDNFPVNDALPWNLFLGPYVGRDARLDEAIRGIVVNLMGQPSASRVPLATVAAYLRDPRGYDPEAAHASAIAEIGAGASDALALLAAHHRGHPVLAAEDEGLDLARHTDAAFGRLSGGAEAIAALARYLDELALCGTRLERELGDAALSSELAPWSDKLAHLARAARAGLDALAGVAPADEFRALRAAAQARPERVACTTLPPGLVPFVAGAGEAVDRFDELFAAIERRLA